MGVPFYFRVIAETYPDILRFSPPPEGCDAFFLDFNGAIHTAARTVLDTPATGEATDPEPAIMESVWAYFEACARAAAPRRAISVCMDGVAPIAKMFQQRKRRYLSMFRHTLAGTTPRWDTNAISPGTPFMARFHAFFRSCIRNRADPTGPRIHFYPSDEPGEGEHKIFAQIAALPPGERAYVYGLDADLIMLSLLAHRPGIFLMREPTHPYTPAQCDNGFMYLDVDALRRGILREIVDRYHWPLPADMDRDPFGPSACEAIEAYLVLCMLMGNDFVPHLVSLSLKKNGLERVLAAARPVWEFLGMGPVDTGRRRLATPFFAHLLDALAPEEDDDFLKHNREYLRRRPPPSDAFPGRDPFDGYPLEPAHKDPLAAAIEDANGQRWRALYYKHLWHTRPGETGVIATSCEGFLYGIQWTYLYYKRLSKDASWYYPYGYAPTLQDLSNFLKASPGFYEGLPEDGWTTTGFVHPFVQLLTIMPPQSAKILPSALAPFFTDPARGCAHLFPTTYPIQTYAKYHLWDCTPVLPPIDIPHVSGMLQKRRLIPAANSPLQR